MSRGATGGAAGERAPRRRSGGAAARRDLLLADLEDTRIPDGNRHDRPESSRRWPRPAGRSSMSTRGTTTPGPPQRQRRHDDRGPAGRPGLRLPLAVGHHRLSADPLRLDDGLMDRKLAVIAAYASQSDRDYLDEELIRAQARHWGASAGSRYAEPLEVIRERTASDAGPVATAATPRRCPVRTPELTLPSGRPRVLITGAGGPAAVSALLDLPDAVVWVAADVGPHAVGLYLVPPSRRVLVPRGDDPELVDRLLRACLEHGVDVLWPTVDSELLPVAEAADRFAAAGVRVLAAPVPALKVCLDKWRLAERCRGVVRVPATSIVTGAGRPRRRAHAVRAEAAQRLGRPRCPGGARAGGHVAVPATAHTSGRSTCRATSTPSTCCAARTARWPRRSRGGGTRSTPASRSRDVRSATPSWRPSARPSRPRSGSSASRTCRCGGTGTAARRCSR